MLDGFTVGYIDGSDEDGTMKSQGEKRRNSWVKITRIMFQSWVVSSPSIVIDPFMLLLAPAGFYLN